jgi:NADH:ubiquinone reductase (non-electrogenic)
MIATPSAVIRPYSNPSRSLSSIAARASRVRATPSPTQLILRRNVRRSYADEAAPKPPKAKKGGGFRTFARWTWRLTYLSALGGLAYVGYGIVLLRNPAEQEEPDPTKKTLVVLGKDWYHTSSSINANDCYLQAPVGAPYHC